MRVNLHFEPTLSILGSSRMSQSRHLSSLGPQYELQSGCEMATCLT